jgi:hypothetical protein
MERFPIGDERLICTASSGDDRYSPTRLESGEAISFMDTRCVLVRVERHDIGLLCSFMAGYEGVAIVRTVDPKQGLVALLVAPAFYRTVLDIIRALSQEMPLCLLMTEASDMQESVRPGAGLAQ